MTEPLETVTWFPAFGMPDYEVSNLGGLRTVDGELIPLKCSSPNGTYYYEIPDGVGGYIHITLDEFLEFQHND